MELFVIFPIIAFLASVGNALLLLRTPRKPELPDQPCRDGDGFN